MHFLWMMWVPTSPGISERRPLLSKKEKAVEEEDSSLKYLLEMASWDLNPKMVTDPPSLIKSLSAYKGMTVTFASYANDGGPYFTCSQVVDAARSAQMLVTDKCGTERPTLDPIKGIFVKGPDTNLSASLATLIKRAVGEHSMQAENGGATLLVFLGTRYGFSTKAPGKAVLKKITPEERKQLFPETSQKQ